MTGSTRCTAPDHDFTKERVIVILETCPSRVCLLLILNVQVLTHDRSTQPNLVRLPGGTVELFDGQTQYRIDDNRELSYERRLERTVRT